MTESTVEPMRGRPGGTPRRDAILVAAGRLFAQRGYDAVSIRDIAHASRIRSATLYSHFSSKAEILSELCQSYFDALLPVMRKEAKGTEDGASRFVALLRSSVEVQLEHRDAFLAFSHSLSYIETGETLSELVRQRDEGISLWRRVVRDGIRDGSLRADLDEDITLGVIFATFVAMVQDRSQRQVLRSSTHTAETVGRIVLDGIRARPGRRR